MPTPFVPLGIRDMENHAVALNLSGFLGDGFWFAGYAGWVVDRYASNGLGYCSRKDHDPAHNWTVVLDDLKP